jgi:predicted P-loop ATPase
LKIACGDSRYSTTWKNQDTAWETFAHRVQNTLITPETITEYLKMTKPQQDRIKDCGGFVFGELAQGRRKNENVLCRSALTLDIDHGEPGIWDLIDAVLPYRLLAYGTHKFTPDQPRLRLVIPLSRPVTPDAYQAIARKVAEKVGLDYFDDTTYQPERMMFWPSTPADVTYFYRIKDGPLLRPDDWLALYHDWRDTATWPTSSRESAVVDKKIARQADPLTKKGLIGAFCRTYSIRKAIEAFIPDYALTSTDGARYDYTPGESYAGVVTYDDKFSYSHHATDPAGDVLCNAWDLVRLHRFKKLDDETDPKTPANRLPSYRAMVEWALEQPEVKQTLAQDRHAQAVSDFDEPPEDASNWETALELDKRGNIVNKLGNLRLILENDPKLKGLAYNELRGGIEIRSTVPWQHHNAFWRDADEAQLINYIDRTYTDFAKRHYDVAIAVVTDNRSFHPIRDYLDSLPPWDGVPRVDTLLIDYLGAEDNPYTRAVIRKWLCAAVRRVQQPGIKFDTMLILEGPQGIGKSTLLAKLGRNWFSDSLSLTDTKDKTAAEKLQGFWLIEFGEMAGHRKAEVETLKSFITRQDDIYRQSYGRNTEHHPRQCVFAGTTNTESGYLRDTTGNRRFWPVHVEMGYKHPWELKNAEIDQIWTETKVLCEQGEKLYIDSAALADYAVKAQQSALETDEREGLVTDYLGRLLPENWDSMDLIERRAYLSDPLSPNGTTARQTVCCLEIWCEYFGKDRSDITRKDSNEIKAILTKLGWENTKMQKLKLYGPQKMFRKIG